MSDSPAIQLISNLVVHDDRGRVLLARYDATGEVAGVDVISIELSRVQSFRGRRGWHVSFDYAVRVSGEPGQGSVPADWFDRTDLPPTMHGNWERDTIDSVLD